MTLREEIRNILREYTEVKFSSSKVTDEIFALIKPRFDKIRDNADKAFSEGPPPFSGQSDVDHMRDRLRDIITLCTLDEPVVDDKCEEIAKMIADWHVESITQETIGTRELTDNIMALIKESESCTK